MKQTKAQLKGRLDAVNEKLCVGADKIRNLERENAKLISEIHELKQANNHIQIQRDELGNLRMQFVRVLAGKSKPISKVEVLEDLIGVEVEHIRQAIRRGDDPFRRDPICRNQFF